MENSYAQALWTVIENGMKPQEAVIAMHGILKIEKREALLPRIARAFERIAAHARDRDSVTLAVADKSHEHAALKELAASGLDTKDVKPHVDPTLIGGWRFEGREQLIDASYKKHLLAIYHAATRS